MFFFLFLHDSNSGNFEKDLQKHSKVHGLYKQFTYKKSSIYMHLSHRISLYVGGLCPRLRDCPKNEYVAEKRNFEGKCEILKTLSSKDIIS